MTNKGPIQIFPAAQPPGDYTGSQLSGSITLAPAILPVYAGYQLVDGSNPYVMDFEIPAQVRQIQKVLLTFQQHAAVYVQQSGTISSLTTATESATHIHTAGTESATHKHNLSIGSGGLSGTVNVASPNGPLQLTSGGPLTDTQTVQTESATHAHTLGTESATHTHTLAGGSVTLGAPTQLNTTGGATSTTINILRPTGGTVTGATPPPTQPQPPYGVGQTDLDLTQYFPWPLNLGVGLVATYSLRLTTTTIGGYTAQLLIVCSIGST